jgi:maltose O-acetyltransferase
VRSHLSPRWHLLVNVVAGSRLAGARTRARLYRWAGIRVEQANVRPGVEFHDANVRIGRDTFVNSGCVFAARGGIEIGERCALGHEVLLNTVGHELGPAEKRAGERVDRPIRIGDGAWIGTRATVLDGVTIGAGCVIAAGAVVTRDCEPDGLYAGVPAVRKRDLTPRAA